MILADTDVLIDALRGRDPSRARIEEGLERGTLATTTISAFELSSGARSDRQANAIRDLLAAMPLFSFDLESAKAAARIRLELEGSGRKIGMGDYLIAGIAVSRSVPLLTRNRKHFERVPGLQLADL
jgi:predicted nucleic acid-binding protein